MRISHYDSTSQLLAYPAKDDTFQLANHTIASCLHDSHVSSWHVNNFAAMLGNEVDDFQIIPLDPCNSDRKYHWRNSRPGVFQFN